MNSVLMSLLFSGLGAIAPQILPLLQQFGVGENNAEQMKKIQALLQNGGSLASLFGNASSQYGNYARQQEQQAYERNFAQSQYLYNQQQNQINRELSSPIGQITAYKRAGLSPDLLFGQLSQPFMSSGVSQPIPTSMPQTNSLESLQASNLLESTEKTKNENKQLNELLKGIKFDNVEKEFNAILHNIFKQAVENVRDDIEYGIQAKIETFFNESFANNKKSAINTQFITELYKEFVYDKDGVEFPTDKLKELSSLFVDNELKGFNLENITKSLSYYYEKARYNDKEFWYSSEKLTQECVNEVNRLAKTNAIIESDFLNGEITKETFFKALLLVLSRGVGGITINKKDTDVHNETSKNYSNTTYNDIDKFFDNRGRKN